MLAHVEDVQEDNFHRGNKGCFNGSNWIRVRVQPLESSMISQQARHTKPDGPVRPGSSPPLNDLGPGHARAWVGPLQQEDVACVSIRELSRQYKHR